MLYKGAASKKCKWREFKRHADIICKYQTAREINNSYTPAAHKNNFIKLVTENLQITPGFVATRNSVQVPGPFLILPNGLKVTPTQELFLIINVALSKNKHGVKVLWNFNRLYFNDLDMGVEKLIGDGIKN